MVFSVSETVIRCSGYRHSLLLFLDLVVVGVVVVVLLLLLLLRPDITVMVD